MSRVVVFEQRCKGCLLCTTVCPKQIIIKSGRFNGQGYEVVEIVDQERCTACASCGLICPDVALRVFASPKDKDKKAQEVSHG